MRPASTLHLRLQALCEYRYALVSLFKTLMLSACVLAPCCLLGCSTSHMDGIMNASQCMNLNVAQFTGSYSW